MAFPSSQTLIDDNPHPNQQQSPPSPSESSDLENHNSSRSQIRFLPLRHVSKKVRARKLTVIDESSLLVPDRKELVQAKQEPDQKSPVLRHVYYRRRLKKSLENHLEEAQLVQVVKVKSELGLEDDAQGFVGQVLGSPTKKRRVGSSEVEKLGLDSTINGTRLRHLRCLDNGNPGISNRKPRSNHKNLGKKWLQVALDGVDPVAFVGLKCKVYWPLDNAWYQGTVSGYDKKSKGHKVKYNDGDEEELILLHEQIKFHISDEEMRKLNIRSDKRKDDNDPDYSQLIGLAATVDESRELEPGDIIWAKLAGYAMWPAVILDEALVSSWKGLKLNKRPGGRSVPVQFFGSHDFARIQAKQAVSFIKGLISCFHLKGKSSQFLSSLKEARMYLNEQRLPASMLSMQRAYEDVQTIDSSDDSKADKELSDSEGVSKFCANKMLERHNDMPSGYRPVNINWRDLDRCNVCHMDEEYENNLFLQCDKCRMMVHARCYGEQPVDGVLWLCNLCRVGPPQFTPPCRLCPVAGGAMKPTTDGQWAHLACAIWIPETCLSDITKMEPIDGISRINKDRWKLLCSICGIPYGACIQCSNNTCRVAYHPLCARAAGFCVELEDEDKLHLTPIDEEDEEGQCIRLLSFCKRHKQPSIHFPMEDEFTGKNTSCSSYNPPPNKFGCARCEPYDYSSRRGRKEPEVLAAASMKRLFLENMPYLVGGDRLHRSLTLISEEDNILKGSALSSWIQNRTSSHGSSGSILSMADKYKYMRETFRKRLAFGKSRIHGYGIFAKQPHKAGDMVIEYTGELVRPPVADRREHLIYNSLVGAGTYMFRIDDERVIDATRAGSIAHLINHSCEPNCYSRVITVSGDEHIIIFAKRDIKQWEELTYDYRFLSVDEQLKCYCGSQRCRGVVNDTEAEGQATKLCVRRSELIDWNGK